MELSSLSPELLEKVKNCKSIEELRELCAAESIKLSDEEIIGLAGGGCMQYTYPSVCRGKA